MAEALKVEKKNAKSLNRWEEMEKKRAEEQQAKLDALHNREIEGPVATFWSGTATWVGDKLVKVGSKEVTHQPKEHSGEKRGRKKKQIEPEANVADSAKTSETIQVTNDVVMVDGGKAATAEPKEVPNQESSSTQHSAPQPAAETSPTVQNDANPQSESAINESNDQAMLGMTEPQDRPSDTTTSRNDTPTTSENHDNSVKPAPEVAPLPSESSTSAPAIVASATTQSSPPEISSETTPVAPVAVSTETPPTNEIPAPSEPIRISPLVTELPLDSDTNPSVPQPDPEYSTRNWIILSNFESMTLEESKSTSEEFAPLQPREKGVKPPKLVKHVPQLCVITSKPAKYRDPETGLPYAIVFA